MLKYSTEAGDVTLARPAHGSPGRLGTHAVCRKSSCLLSDLPAGLCKRFGCWVASDRSTFCRSVHRKRKRHHQPKAADSSEVYNAKARIPEQVHCLVVYLEWPINVWQRQFELFDRTGPQGIPGGYVLIVGLDMVQCSGSHSPGERAILASPTLTQICGKALADRPPSSHARSKEPLLTDTDWEQARRAADQANPVRPR